MTTVLLVIHALGMFLFGVALLVDWVRSFKQIRRYFKYGVWAGLSVLALELLLLVWAQPEWTGALIGLLSAAVGFTQVMGFAMLGIHYCTLVGHPSLPLFLTGDHALHPPDPVPAPAPQTSTASVSPDPGDPQPTGQAPLQLLLAPSAPPPAAVERPPLPVRVDRRECLAASVAAAAAGVLHTVGLFLLVRPRPTELAERVFGGFSSEAGSAVAVDTIAIALAAAISEEVVFRLGIQSFLARYLRLQGRAYWLAIAISAALWTAGHAGTLDPEWAKLAQIFPIGLVFGWLFRKYGAESSILAHALLNMALLFLAGYLLE